MEKKRINMDLDKSLWHDVSIQAARENQEKKQIVEKALENYLKQVRENARFLCYLWLQWN